MVGQGLTTDAGFTFTFENWNLFDDQQDWCDATTGTHAERLAKLADPARRPALRKNLPVTAVGPLPDIAIVGPKLAKNKQWLDYTLAHAGEKMGKHPVDVMLDMAVEENLETEFFAAPRHPYSKMLLASTLPPIPRRDLPKLPDAPPANPFEPPSGCAFHPRCRHATARCAAEARLGVGAVVWIEFAAGDRKAELGGPDRRDITAGSGADDEYVELHGHNCFFLA